MTDISTERLISIDEGFLGLCCMNGKKLPCIKELILSLSQFFIVAKFVLCFARYDSPITLY